MKQSTSSKIILLATFLSLGSHAQTETGRGKTIKIIAPESFTFTLSPMAKEATNCSQLNRLLKNYGDNRCDTDKGTFYCKSILAQIQVAQTLDYQNINPMENFVRGYLVKPFTNIPDPTTFSKRFDVSYASSYDFDLSSLEKPSTFHFGGNMTSAELSAESNLGSSLGFEMVMLQGRKYLKVDSKIRACALETGRIHIIGTSKVSVSGNHPIGNVVYDIVEETYRKTLNVAAKPNLTDNQRNFLLGLIAGEQLKKMSAYIKDDNELDDIALSLQAVILDSSKSKFSLVPAELDARLGLTLLEPGLAVPNAPVQIIYQGE